MGVIERVVCHARSSSTPKLQQFRVEARSQPREGVWQAPVSSSFGRKPLQMLKQDSESPLQNPSLPLQRQINGEPAYSTIPTWFEDWERATLEDLPVPAKMNSFSPSEIERIHLPKECKRLIIWVRLPINGDEPSERGVKGVLLQLRLHSCLGCMMRLLSLSTI